MRHKRCILAIALAVVLVFTTTAGAAKRPTTVAELALYRGADRQQILEEGAKKEGKLQYYTTSVMAGALAPFMDLFQKKYPYIKLVKWRADSRRVARKIMEEYHAGRHVVDVIEATQLGILPLKEKGIFQPFYSPGLANINEEAITRAPGGDAFSVAFRIHGISLGYNTKLMTREEAPQTYQDLLDPKWKGKMAITTSGTTVSWMGTMYKFLGEEFVKKVAQQNFDIHAISGRTLLDLVISGEYSCAPTIFGSQVAKSRKKGAPIDWVPLEPVHVNTTSIALPKHSSHPHAAMLLVDLTFSKEMAEIQKVNGYTPTHKDFPSE
ncbi:ABC transporter substrate-binding protein, partial [Thermodesulfobacteriota bacterium]